MASALPSFCTILSFMCCCYAPKCMCKCTWQETRFWFWFSSSLLSFRLKILTQVNRFLPASNPEASLFSSIQKLINHPGIQTLPNTYKQQPTAQNTHQPPSAVTDRQREVWLSLEVENSNRERPCRVVIHSSLLLNWLACGQSPSIRVQVTHCQEYRWAGESFFPATQWFKRWH